MTTFLLIRHAETGAADKSLSGSLPGWGLNSSGKRQALNLAEKLSTRRIHAVYTSPLERAIETAVPIAHEFGLQAQPVAELEEMHFGEWQGMTFEELGRRADWKRFNSLRSVQRCPGGELMAETQTRIVRQLDCLRHRHPGETVAVVSHADPLRSAIAFFLGIPLDFLLRFEISPASVSVLEIAEWGPRLLCLNSSVESIP